MRDYVAELNERIRKARVGLLDGPRWCSRRSTPIGSSPAGERGDLLDFGDLERLAGQRVAADEVQLDLGTSVNQRTGRVSGGGASGVKTTGNRPKRLPSNLEV